MPRATVVASGRPSLSYAVILVVTDDDQGATKYARCSQRGPASYALTSVLVVVDSNRIRVVPAGADPLISCSCASPLPALNERDTPIGGGGGAKVWGVGVEVPTPQFVPPPPGTASAR